MKKQISEKNNRNKNILVFGFALFSMFFGAGNIIFPPYIGLTAAGSWFSGFIAYFIADIGLALLTIFAILKNEGDVEAITGRLGRIPGILLTSVIILCIGPLLAIPRTGAATYELGVKFLAGESTVSAIITSVVFFGITLALTLRESSVVDIIGKILTPALFIGLMVLIIKGIITPIGPVAESPLLDGVIASGIISGYQTMGVLGSLALGIFIVNYATQKGAHSYDEKRKLIAPASFVAAGCLLLVYGGLTYLGATASMLYGPEISRAQLVIHIVEHIAGSGGIILLCIVVALACLTTSAALVGTTATYFSRLSKGKFSYKALVIVVCILSAVMSNVGLDTIIAIASPVLTLVYPCALVLIVLTFFKDRIKNKNIYIFSAVGAMCISFLEILHGLNLPVGFVAQFPMSEYGFAWIIPAIVCGAAGALFSKGKIRPVKGS